jgi:acetyltransferase-like isoleucine patch superfamily enzyme
MQKKRGIPKERKIPYYDEIHKDSFFKTLRLSANTKNKNVIIGTCRRLLNVLLSKLAYSFPLRSFRVKFYRMMGVHIGKNSGVGLMCVLDSYFPEYIMIKDNVAVNQGTLILTHTNPLSIFSNIIEAKVSPVILEDYCFVGVNCTILPGVRIGKFSIVSAGAVVTKDVPDYTIVAGNPAKKVVNIEKLMKQ